MTGRPSSTRYIVLLGLCLAAGLAYVHRGCLGVADSKIRADLGLSVQDTAWAASIFFWTYACFQIPTGVLVDRWGARKSLLLFGMLGAFTVALGASTLVLGASVGFIVLFTSRALMGVAQAGLFPASTRCIATWFPLRRRAFAAGTLQACMSIGGAVGAIITGQLLLAVTWPWVFVIFAIPGVIWSLWFFSWYRDRPAEHKSVNAAELELLKPPPNDENHLKATGPTPWLKLLTRPKLLWVSFAQYFRAGANVFWLFGCPTYLQKVYGISTENSGMLTSLPFLGVVLGSLFGGWLSDLVLAKTGSKRWSRNGVANGTAAIGIGFFVLAWLIQAGPYVAIALLFLAALFTAPGNPCSYSVSIDIGGRYMAVAFGALNMLGNFGSATFPLVVPQWANAFGWSSIPLLMAFVYFLGFVCWCFVNPNGLILDAKESAPAPEKPTTCG
ncbi:MAG: MFS transporter [Planctomycetes bacterium]|nr:MFS transporter [Planctomycetota bacterium]